MKLPQTLNFPSSLANTGRIAAITVSVSHDVKATYVLYLGWFDGNPATLDELPPEEGAKIRRVYGRC